MNNAATTTLPAHRADSETPAQNEKRVPPLAPCSGRGWQRGKFRFMAALFGIVSVLTGAPLPGFVTPASAEGLYTYQPIK